MKVVEHTVNSADELEYWVDEHPYEIEPHGERDPYVAVLSFNQSMILGTDLMEPTYLNEDKIKTDGLEIATINKINAKPTSIVGLDHNSHVIMVYNHKIDGYDVLQAETDLLGVDVEKNGNDIEINGKKVYGVGSLYTDHWLCVGQVDALTLPLDDYLNLPDKKFEDKAANNINDRVTSLSEAVGQTVTVAEVADAVRSVVSDG